MSIVSCIDIAAKTTFIMFSHNNICMFVYKNVVTDIYIILIHILPPMFHDLINAIRVELIAILQQQLCFVNISQIML